MNSDERDRYERLLELARRIDHFVNFTDHSEKHFLPIVNALSGVKDFIDKRTGYKRCQFCGEEYFAGRGSQKYCSNYCRQARYYRDRKARTTYSPAPKSNIFKPEWEMDKESAPEVEESDVKYVEDDGTLEKEYEETVVYKTPEATPDEVDLDDIDVE